MEFNLLLNEDKTEIALLPEGVFREWVSKYHTVRPKKNKTLTFQEFKELYLAVLRIDQEIPGTGIIDRFIVDVTDAQYNPLFPVTSFHIEKILSLLLLMAERRIRSFPRILGLVESMMVASGQKIVAKVIERHLNKLLSQLSNNQEENRYLISWILYFLKSNRLTTKQTFSVDDPILQSIQSNKCKLFPSTKVFKLFRGVRSTRKTGKLLKHLDVFKPQ
ncbi:MAG: hypothetical protein JW828_11270 [Sedimentisphaerales bacterium]|nr:hypothetical protein [Sedimentisphaerales bacterium]